MASQNNEPEHVWPNVLASPNRRPRGRQAEDAAGPWQGRYDRLQIRSGLGMLLLLLFDGPVLRKQSLPSASLCKLRFARFPLRGWHNSDRKNRRQVDVVVIRNDLHETQNKKAPDDPKRGRLHNGTRLQMIQNGYG